jgi:hypothetical protein
MNSATLLSSSPGLFARVRDIITSENGKAAWRDDAVQFEIRSGGLFTVFDFDDTYWASFEIPDFLRSCADDLSACEIECRSSEVVIEMCRRFALEVSPLWIVDFNGRVWDAANLDRTFRI